MKLLILTQKVDRNDVVLGFFHQWVEEFAKYYDYVTVVCLEKGKYELAQNVSVYSLGKERGVSKVTYIARFYMYIWRFRREYDCVFVHMNPEYIVLGGLLWRIMGKCTALWYTHRQVHWKLRIATYLSHIIFSASGYSFNIKTKKLSVMRHGIDTKHFVCENTDFHQPLSIISVGRISPIKNPDTLIEAAHILKASWPRPFTITLYGTPSDEYDERYKKSLEETIVKYGLQGTVRFAGDVPNHRMPAKYCDADVVVNLTPTGGIDKTVLEGMSASRLVLVSNEAFREHFGAYAARLTFRERDAHNLAEKLQTLVESTDIEEVRAFLHKQASEQFDVTVLIETLVDRQKTVCAQ